MNSKKSVNDNFEDLCAGYALHLLNEQERKEFEQRLASASEKEYLLFRKYEEAAHHIVWAAEEIQSPADLKERLIQEVSSQPKTTTSSVGTDPTNDRFSWPAFGIAASFALLIISLSLVFYALNLRTEINQKELVAEQQEIRIKELQNNLSKYETLLSGLNAATIQITELKGLETNPVGHGKIFWSPGSQLALLQVSNLTPMGDETTYQLWVVINSEWKNAGILNMRNGAPFFFERDKISDKSIVIDAFAITLEPDGQISDQPMGETILFGHVE